MNRLAIVSTAFSIFSVLAASRSALLWYRASKVNIVPHWLAEGGLEPLDPQNANTEWIIALIGTGRKSGEINRKAALWTAIAAVLSAISTIFGIAASIYSNGS